MLTPRWRFRPARRRSRHEWPEPPDRRSNSGSPLVSAGAIPVEIEVSGPGWRSWVDGVDLQGVPDAPAGRRGVDDAVVLQVVRGAGLGREEQHRRPQMPVGDGSSLAAGLGADTFRCRGARGQCGGRAYRKHGARGTPPHGRRRASRGAERRPQTGEVTFVVEAHHGAVPDSVWFHLRDFGADTSMRPEAEDSHRWLAASPAAGGSA